MRGFRSTESHLNLLRASTNLKPSKAPTKRGTFNINRAFSSGTLGNYTATSRFVDRSQRQIKLTQFIQKSLFNTAKASFKDIPLLNPEKSNPESLKDLVVAPISPLTLSRFPRNDGSDKMPSVTKILQATMPASNVFLLDKWKEAMIKKLGVAGFAKYQQDTFERGRLLHAVLANYLLGHGEPTEELEKEIVANLWKSIQNVVKEKISNVRLVEHIVTHPDLKYRGIVDCVAFYQDELVVIDFKTAEKPKKNVSSLFDNPLQVTAYCGAINNDRSISKHVIDRNICSGLVIVAYIDGSEASVYHLGREKVLNEYWTKWTDRLEQFSRLEEMKSAQDKANVVSGDKPK